MDFSWIALLLLSFVWTSAFHIYEPATPLWLIFVLAAFALIFAEYNRRQKLSRAVSAKNALKYGGLILMAQGAVFPFLCILAAREHAESVFAPIAGGMLNLFGLRTVCEGSTLYIDGFLRTVVFSSTWEKTGLIYLALFIVGGMVMLLLKKARIKQYAAFFAMTAVYAVLRYVFLIMLYAVYGMHSLFWERLITLVSFVPYAVILASVFKQPLNEITFKLRGFPRPKVVVTLVLAFLLVFSGVSFFGFRDLGAEKQGRVLVDDYYSDWEWTTDIYDEEWFGERSGYNYYCFYNYLDKFYETRRNMDAITADTLKDVDVFIMKTPTMQFKAQEIAYMHEFVENGGGLYLIGDHTNVFGTGANLNQISEDFGFVFNYDCTYELKSGSLSEYDAPGFIPHPVVSGLPHFLFATSNTLGANWQAEEMIVGYGLRCLPADYSQMNFFPEDANDPNVEFGLFLQSAGLQHGKGRVLAFTDSTVFSNFWMFMPGKPELLLSSVQWLNRENTLVGITPRALAAIFLLISLVLNIAWIINNRKAFPLAIYVLSGTAAFVIASTLFQITSALALPPPEPIKPMTNISFEREYSTYKLPNDLDGFLSNMDEQLNTFYVWTQRLDYFPSVEARLSRALENGDLTVMAKPDREIDDPQSILDEIASGKKLLVLDNTTSGGHANSLLTLAGMELTNADMAEFADYGEIRNIPLTDNASAITGGTALIRDTSGNAVFSVTKIGNGILAVFSDPDLLYSFEMGDVSANLTDKTEILTDMTFELLKELLAD